MKIEHHEKTQAILEIINAVIPHYELVWQREYGNGLRSIIGVPGIILNNDYDNISVIHDLGYYVHQLAINIEGFDGFLLWVLDTKENLMRCFECKDLSAFKKVLLTDYLLTDYLAKYSNYEN